MYLQSIHLNRLVSRLTRVKSLQSEWRITKALQSSKCQAKCVSLYYPWKIVWGEAAWETEVINSERISFLHLGWHSNSSPHTGQPNLGFLESLYVNKLICHGNSNVSHYCSAPSDGQTLKSSHCLKTRVNHDQTKYPSHNKGCQEVFALTRK